jgi:hypothetical protein
MVHRLTGLASLALLVPALYWAVLVERADWLFIKGDAASIRQAIRLAPGNAEYYSSLAQAEPDRAVAILTEAVALNPLDCGLRVELGLAEERRGDFYGAEAHLVQAMRLDTGFAPRRALADFYFHRHDAERFWPVVKAALAMSSGDASPQFRNCWALSSNPQTILERAIPDRPVVWRKYLDFLLTEGRLDAAVPVAHRVLARADKDATPSLLNYCDRMLADWRGEEASAVWNGLVERKLPASPDRGFNWRISPPDGIFADRSPSAVTLTFSGRQPENAEILSQYVALMPNRRYVLRARCRASGIAAESGLTATLACASGEDLLGGRGVLPGGEGNLEQSIPFQTPDATLGRLILGYHRKPGTIRIEGSLTLQHFVLSPGEDR